MAQSGTDTAAEQSRGATNQAFNGDGSGAQKMVYRTSDDATLYNEMYIGIGKKILRSFREGFEDLSFAGVPQQCTFDGNTGSQIQCVISGVRKLLEVLVAYGYALSSNVVEVRRSNTNNVTKDTISDDESSDTTSFSFVSTMIGSATLWANQSMFLKKCTCHACYENMIIDAFLREARIYDTFAVETSTIINPDSNATQSIWKFMQKVR